VNQAHELESVHPRHVDIRDHAVDLGKASALKQCRGRRKEAYRVVRRFEERFERLQDGLIVIDHCNYERWSSESHVKRRVSADFGRDGGHRIYEKDVMVDGR